MANKHEPSYMEFYEVQPAAKDEVETESTAEDEDESEAESELENMDASFEESEDEDESEESSDDDEGDESDTEGESEETDGDKPAKPKEPELSEEEKRKAHNREMAERRIKEKQDREVKIKEEQQKYVSEADSDDPHEIALRQLQVDAYNNNVDRNSNKLTNGYERALKDFDILRDPDPAIQRRLDRALDSFQAAHVAVDKYGNPTEVRGDLYSYLQDEADSIRELTGKGARQQANAKDKEKSKTFTPPTRKPKEAKKDPQLEAFDEEANRY